MRKITLGIAMLATVAALTGCQSKSALAEKLNGSWAGAPERMYDTDASSATIIEAYTFEKADTVENGGAVVVSSLMSVTGAIEGTEGIISPVSLTASGYGSVTGTWEVTKDNQVALSLDMASLKVTVDPSAVVIASNALTGQDSPVLDNMKPQLALSIEHQLQKAVTDRYSALMTLNSVKLSDNNNELSFKIDKQEYSLHRQQE